MLLREKNRVAVAIYLIGVAEHDRCSFRKNLGEKSEILRHAFGCKLFKIVRYPPTENTFELTFNSRANCPRGVNETSSQRHPRVNPLIAWRVLKRYPPLSDEFNIEQTRNEAD